MRILVSYYMFYVAYAKYVFSHVQVCVINLHTYPDCEIIQTVNLIIIICFNHFNLHV